MNRKPNPADHPNQSLQKFHEIYKKLLSDSWAFASKEALSSKLENKKAKTADKDS